MCKNTRFSLVSVSMHVTIFNSNDLLPLKLLRNFGLGVAERVAPAKNKVMRFAMGLEGTLPALARGEKL